MFLGSGFITDVETGLICHLPHFHASFESHVRLAAHLSARVATSKLEPERLFIRQLEQAFAHQRVPFLQHVRSFLPLRARCFANRESLGSHLPPSLSSAKRNHGGHFVQLEARPALESSDPDAVHTISLLARFQVACHCALHVFQHSERGRLQRGFFPDAHSILQDDLEHFAEHDLSTHVPASKRRAGPAPRVEDPLRFLAFRLLDWHNLFADENCAVREHPTRAVRSESRSHAAASTFFVDNLVQLMFRKRCHKHRVAVLDA
mmetsp:Transcript_599/g.1030  ORF Transcript_599/g.1030 Transcript_599/m.1030 type:complete len:263 (-) Transcript_599:839-1627(-)